VSSWKASFVVPAIERLPWEEALEHLNEDGFVVTSREVSRKCPSNLLIKRLLGSERSVHRLPATTFVATLRGARRHGAQYPTAM